MKKVVLLICMLFITGCATFLTPTMKNAPADFRGIEFGTNLNTLSDMIIEYQDEVITRCIRIGERLEVMGYKVDKISYNFYKGKFYEGKILFKGIESLHGIKTILSNRHNLPLEAKAAGLSILSGQLTGTGHLIPEQAKEINTWYSDAVYIKLEYISGKGILTYQFISVLKEMEK